MPLPPRPTSYWNYIRVQELLRLQGGVEDDESLLSSEEVVFITVHQVYELWFKLALRDLVAVRDVLAREPVPEDALAGACRRLDRLQVIFGLAVDHFPLIETLTTRDYLEFRDKLFPASGGQSPQFREIEVLLGLGEEERIPYVTGGGYADVLAEEDGSEGWALQRVRARQADRPTLREALDAWLFRTPVHGSGPADPDDAAVVERFVTDYLRAHADATRELAAHAARMTRSADDRAALAARYEREIEQAEAFLRAADVAAAERPRRRRIRAAALFIESYRELPLLAWPRELLDRLVALEQGFVHYRQRHARMVERVIGRRVGTGGSSGVDYLDRSALAYRVFTDLWAVRTMLTRRDRLPEPERAATYGFRFGG